MISALSLVRRPPAPHTLHLSSHHPSVHPTPAQEHSLVLRFQSISTSSSTLPLSSLPLSPSLPFCARAYSRLLPTSVLFAAAALFRVPGASRIDRQSARAFLHPRHRGESFAALCFIPALRAPLSHSGTTHARIGTGQTRAASAVAALAPISIRLCRVCGPRLGIFARDPEDRHASRHGPSRLDRPGVSSPKSLRRRAHVARLSE